MTAEFAILRYIELVHNCRASTPGRMWNIEYNVQTERKRGLKSCNIHTSKRCKFAKQCFLKLSYEKLQVWILLYNIISYTRATRERYIVYIHIPYTSLQFVIYVYNAYFLIIDRCVLIQLQRALYRALLRFSFSSFFDSIGAAVTMNIYRAKMAHVYPSP